MPGLRDLNVSPEGAPEGASTGKRSDKNISSYHYSVNNILENWRGID